MCGEFSYESNGSFGNENGIRTRNLGPKQRNESGIGRHCPRQCHFGNVAGQSRELPRYPKKIRQMGQNGCVFCATLTATLTKCQCRVAFSRGIPDKWVFPLSFLIFHPNTSLSLIPVFSQHLGRFEDTKC